ncbi:MAG: hypothetical protein RLZZ618_414 [Pseudomonadota bacterium]|jgi:pimeloyl-ACP methyl ester carboxylesterase
MTSSAVLSPAPTAQAAYQPRRESRSEFITVRGLKYHVRHWGDASLETPERPPLVLMHGWMDIGASFQFVVDALAELEGPDRHIIAADWRGFGLTESPIADGYWFPDYLGDLDALIDHWIGPLDNGRQVDLLGHSMGGNVVMLYGGIRPKRIRKLINLEGFGQPASKPTHAPKRYAKWLDELKEPQMLRGYSSVEAVAHRLQKNNPLLRADRAAWLAGHWARPDDNGEWKILGDPAHKRSNANIYRKEEAMACWELIEAPLMWIEGDQTDTDRWWGGKFTKPEFHERLSVVKDVRKHVLSPAGHMLHHDQPQALAQHLRDFLG